MATLVYCAGVVSFSMLITSFFHTSSSAVKGAMILWAISFGWLISIFLSSSIVSFHLYLHIWIYQMPHCDMASVCMYMCRYPSSYQDFN